MRTSSERAEKGDEREVPFRQHEHVRGHRARVVPELPGEQTFDGRTNEEMNREKRREIRFQAATYVSDYKPRPPTRILKSGGSPFPPADADSLHERPQAAGHGS